MINVSAHSMIQVDKQTVWEDKLASLTGLSFLQEIKQADKEDVKNLDLQALQHPQYTTIKNKVLFGFAITFVVLCLGVWALAIMHSIVGRVLRGTDFRGNVCGELELIGRDYLYYPSILDSVEFSICTEQCPDAIAGYICLYDKNGTDYELATQDHLCYQTIQSISKGKYCLPYEPISSAYLNDYLNQPDIRMNRIASDVGNGCITIFLCVILAVGLVLIVNLVLIHRAKFLKIFGWLLIGLNLLLLLVATILSFAHYSEKVKLYCINELGNENEQCLFGDVLTYKSMSFTMVSICGVYILLNLILLKRAKATINLQVLSRIFGAAKKHIACSFVMLTLHVILTLFFGSAALMALSDSEILQKQVSTIDGGFINTIQYNSRRYFLLGFALLFYIISVKALEKIHYFIIALEFSTQLTKKELIKSIFCHGGQLFAVALFTTILYPLKIFCKCIYWLFSQLDQSSSCTRFLQQHILFHPFLWLHCRFLRYLNDEVIALFPHSCSFRLQVRLYYLLKQTLNPICKQLPSSFKFCANHLQLFVSGFAGLIAAGLQTPLTFGPLQNLLVVPITTFIVCLLVVEEFVQQRAVLMQVVFTKHEVMVQGNKLDEAEKLSKQYGELFGNVYEDKEEREITKEYLNQVTQQDLRKSYTKQRPQIVNLQSVIKQ